MTRDEVRVLEADPDLVEGLDQELRAEARASAIARRRSVEAGEWTPRSDQFESSSGFGLLILDGFMARKVALGNRWCIELLGKGDVLHPWVDDGEYAVMPFKASFTVLDRLEVAVLDGAVAEVICRWPAVVRSLMTRVMQRSRHLAGLLTLTELPRVETRLHVLLWHLAERFGRVTPDGVVLRIPLSHELLSGMVSARRPTVTTALGRLEERELVVSRGRQEWLLLEEPEEVKAFRRGEAELTA